jgi:hypothetical protein
VLWLVWPRPDAEIRVERGGRAVVANGYGVTRPLGDTVVVGGRGRRRTIRVTNEDTVPHQLALFSVAPGEVRDYVAPPGTFGGVCSAHAGSGRLTVVVR